MEGKAATSVQSISAEKLRQGVRSATWLPLDRDIYIPDQRNAKIVSRYRLLWNGLLDLCPLKWILFMCTFHSFYLFFSPSPLEKSMRAI